MTDGNDEWSLDGSNVRRCDGGGDGEIEGDEDDGVNDVDKDLNLVGRCDGETDGDEDDGVNDGNKDLKSVGPCDGWYVGISLGT